MRDLNERTLQFETQKFSEIVDLDADAFVLLQDLCNLHRLAGKLDGIDEAIAAYRSPASD